MASYKVKLNPFTGLLQFVLDETSVDSLTFKSGVATVGDLPPAGNTKNDARITNDTGNLYVWDGSNWIDQGDIIDLKWASIEDKPLSTVGNIDDAVAKKHTKAVTGIIAPTLVTPDYIGQLYRDTVNNKTYVATGLAQGNWEEIAGGGIGTEENCLLSLLVSQGALAFNTVLNFVDNISGKTINNNIVFNNTTHQATLKAGKTYKLQSSVRVEGDEATEAVYTRWYNVTSASYIGVTGLTAALSHPSTNGVSPVACTIITPSTDIQVELRVTGVEGSTAPGVAFDTAWATIEKITDPIPVGTIEWANVTDKPTSSVGDIDDAVTKRHTINDQTLSEYFDIGTMRMQWGRITYSNDDPTAMTLPAAFGNNTYRVQLSLNAWEYNAGKGPANVSNGISVIAQTTTTFTVNRDNDLANDTVFDWFAIGLKP